jgi:glycosyltransferase involved in cell wall biosynthesis
MSATPPELSVVLPCYNEQEVLPETAKRLATKLEALKAAGKIGPGSRAFFVDDGSQDATWASIRLLAGANPLFEGVKLSRNCGHQNALMAGLLTVPGDIILSMDADLQDDLDAIDAMVDAHAEGADIVYGVRERRDLDTALKRNSARAYYRLLGWFGVKIVFDHADFRLMSRRAIEALREHREVHLFLRALVPLLGFKTATVTYDRAERFAGTSKYPLRRMVRLAIDGVTSFSVRPLRIITLTGFAISAMSFLLGAWALVAALAFGVTVPGWTSTVVPIYLICGIQMLSLGVIGEYVGKIYMETKQRPRFVLDELTWTAASSRSGAPDPVVGEANHAGL